MHVFFQEVGTFVASVTVEDPEITAPWPSTFEVGFGDVHNDGDAVFIIIFDKPMEGVDWVAFDSAIAPLDEFDSFYFGDGKSPFLFLIHPILFNDNIWITSV